MEASGKPNVCSCKGIRTCLLCESPLDSIVRSVEELKCNVYIYCELCQKGWTDRHPQNHPEHCGESIDFPGILLQENFITDTEEEFLVSEIDKTPFVDSQSGRKKQDYGPKVNFKKKKVKCCTFTGLPSFCKFLVDRLSLLPVLSGFVPIELCNLEYQPSRGAAIDPHFDDFWIWGERLVTVNLLSDTYLRMTLESQPQVEVQILLPRRSLLVVYGPARHDWKHAVRRQDIVDRRLAMTFREPASDFLPGGAHCDIGEQLIQIALTYNGVSVGDLSTGR